MTRTEALAKAIEWATKAETAEARRVANLRKAADQASNVHLRHHVQALYNYANEATTDRQTAIDLAAMWTGIAAALPGPQAYIAFTTTEEPQP